MKHLHTFESYINEGTVKQFEFDYKNLEKSIKDGMGWIDPEYVEETWDNIAGFGPIDKVKDEVLNRLIKADLLYFADENHPEKKGKKVTNINQIKKYIKTYENFLYDSSLNETVYQLGFDGSGKMVSRGDSGVKAKTLSLLRSGKWMKNEAGKWAVDKATELSDMWNAKDPSELPGWTKGCSTDKEGKLKMSNFISKTAIIVAVLDEISKRESATMESAGGARNRCFGNSAEWAKNNDGKAIGGICIDKKKMTYYPSDSLVVHAFVEKSGKYYDVTITAPAIVNSLVYWPLITFDNADEKTIAEGTWSYALGIEEAVDEYVEKNL